MANTFNEFLALLPSATTTVITITQVNADGTSNGTTSGGVAVVVAGTSVAAGNKAFVRDGEIVRQAPDLTITTVDI